MPLAIWSESFRKSLDGQTSVLLSIRSIVKQIIAAAAAVIIIFPSVTEEEHIADNSASNVSIKMWDILMPNMPACETSDFTRKIQRELVYFSIELKLNDTVINNKNLCYLLFFKFYFWG